MIRIARMKIFNGSWYVTGAFPAGTSKKEIATILLARIKRECRSRGIELEDIEMDYKTVYQFMDLTSMKLGSAKIVDEIFATC